MKHTLIWKILLILGICPFAAPLLGWGYQLLNRSSFTFGDWMILYSFLFWWTYAVGLGLIVLAAVQLKRSKNAGTDAADTTTDTE